jgi:hypothetical protein
MIFLLASMIFITLLCWDLVSLNRIKKRFSIRKESLRSIFKTHVFHFAKWKTDYQHSRIYHFLRYSCMLKGVKYSFSRTCIMSATKYFDFRISAYLNGFWKSVELSHKL